MGVNEQGEQYLVPACLFDTRRSEGGRRKAVSPFMPSPTASFSPHQLMCELFVISITSLLFSCLSPHLFSFLHFIKQNCSVVWVH